ncbi:NDMA-dependent alcohol dehydrogenase [Rhodococcus sp. NM-2]|uniref:NDMA-dependent alcohol dehydrogenase n=1 Tax=Rhodococcus sp. NM-2 TaxID=3401174 RepID=UPI003AAE9B63
MQTRSAILWESPGKWDVREVELDEPRHGEVLVRVAAAGLCHSDDHHATGDVPFATFPGCGGHEGAGVVEAVGPNVTRVAVGDHVVLAFVPACGHCRMCSLGRQNLCDNGAGAVIGDQLDGTFRMHVDGLDVVQSCRVSAFSERTVVPELSCVKIDPTIPLELACLVGCAVPTGWGSATNAANISPGDATIVVGTGGIGMNAVQGARFVGAGTIVAVDPVEWKREIAHQFGATRSFATLAEADEFVRTVTNGQGADSTIVCVGRTSSEVLGEAYRSVGKAGTLVVTASGSHEAEGLPINLIDLPFLQKRIQGCLYGMSSPNAEIPVLLNLFEQGKLQLAELITKVYSLDEINEAYADLNAGRILRGVVRP